MNLKDIVKEELKRACQTYDLRDQNGDVVERFYKFETDLEEDFETIAQSIIDKLGLVQVYEFVLLNKKGLINGRVVIPIDAKELKIKKKYMVYIRENDK